MANSGATCTMHSRLSFCYATVSSAKPWMPIEGLTTQNSRGQLFTATSPSVPGRLEVATEPTWAMRCSGSPNAAQAPHVHGGGVAAARHDDLGGAALRQREGVD